MVAFADHSLGFMEKVRACASIIFHLPLVLSWTLLTSPFHRTNKHKPWTRVLGDKLYHFTPKHLSTEQLRWILGDSDTLGVYTAYMKSQNLPLVIDELGTGARLLWLGERCTDHVVLYFHGGGYLLPVPHFVLPFWKYVLGGLESNGNKTGFAILQYSFADTSPFPGQLHQAILAVQHLLSIGIHPSNIHLAGDSAGAHLILALFSHVLHPLPNLPRITITSPFGSAYLMSPWVSLTNQKGSMIANDDSDVFGFDALTRWGRIVLDSVPEQYGPYIEASIAPKDWFARLESNVVKRMLITVGDAECLKDGIVEFAEHLRRRHGDVRFVLQEHGVHDDPYFDFWWPWTLLWPRQVKSTLTPVIVDFFASGFIF